MPPCPSSARISYSPSVACGSASVMVARASAGGGPIGMVCTASPRPTGMLVPQRGQNSAPGPRFVPQRAQNAVSMVHESICLKRSRLHGPVERSDAPHAIEEGQRLAIQRQPAFPDHLPRGRHLDHGAGGAVPNQGIPTPKSLHRAHKRGEQGWVMPELPLQSRRFRLVVYTVLHGSALRRVLHESVIVEEVLPDSVE